METRLNQLEIWSYSNNVLNRIKGTINLLEGKLKGGIADCGENNPLKKSIEEYFNLEIDSLDWDFNWTMHFNKKYDIILCFEVLEHIMNPLLFLVELKKLLKDDGVIYLSTPHQKPQIIKAKHHYHEIPTDRLMWLFNAADLYSTHIGNVTIAGNWYNHIFGIRPILRYFQKTRVYKLNNK